MKFSEIKKNVAQVDGVFEQLLNGMKQAFSEGRSQTWTQDAVAELAGRAKEQLKQLRGERHLQLILDRAEARESVKRSDKYNERQYHLQKAQALAQAMTPEQLVKHYRGLVGEERTHKNEYKDVFQARMDADTLPQWFEAVEATNTPEERQQSYSMAAIDTLEKHMETVDNLVSEKIADILSGKYSPAYDVPMLNVFDEIEKNIEQQLSTPEQRAARMQEKAVQMAGETTS